MIKVPSSWNDITVNQFIQIHSLLEKKFNSNDEYYVEIISLLSDTPIDELEELTYEEFNSLIKNVEFLTTPPKFQPREYINTSVGIMYLFNNWTSLLTNGEFIDLEYLFTNGHYVTNLKKILPMFYRFQIKQGTETHPPQWEEYGGWLTRRSELFGEQKLCNVFGVINQFMDWRKEFFQKYEGYFGTSEPEEIEEVENESIISNATRVKEITKQNSYKKWGWNMLMYQLCNSDPLRMNEAYKLPLILSMNILSMKKELDI
jgi:hypothetical protein